MTRLGHTNLNHDPFANSQSLKSHTITTHKTSRPHLNLRVRISQGHLSTDQVPRGGISTPPETSFEHQMHQYASSAQMRTKDHSSRDSDQQVHSKSQIRELRGNGTVDSYKSRRQGNEETWANERAGQRWDQDGPGSGSASRRTSDSTSIEESDSYGERG